MSANSSSNRGSSVAYFTIYSRLRGSRDYEMLQKYANCWAVVDQLVVTRGRPPSRLYQNGNQVDIARAFTRSLCTSQLRRRVVELPRSQNLAFSRSPFPHFSNETHDKKQITRRSFCTQYNKLIERIHTRDNMETAPPINRGLQTACCGGYSQCHCDDSINSDGSYNDEANDCSSTLTSCSGASLEKRCRSKSRNHLKSPPCSYITLYRRIEEDEREDKSIRTVGGHARRRNRGSRTKINSATPITSIEDSFMTRGYIPTRLNNLYVSKTYDENSCKSGDSSTAANTEGAIGDPTSPAIVKPDFKSAPIRTQMPSRQGLFRPRMLPFDYVPGLEDIIIPASFWKCAREGKNDDCASSPAKAHTSIEFEVLIHRTLTQYLMATPQGRGQIVDKILYDIATRGGRFLVRRRSDETGRRWVQVDWKTARLFTAGAIKLASREVLTKVLSARRQERAQSRGTDRRDTSQRVGSKKRRANRISPQEHESQKRVRFAQDAKEIDSIPDTEEQHFGRSALYTKFKRPKHHYESDGERNAITSLNALEILSQVAVSQL